MAGEHLFQMVVEYTAVLQNIVDVVVNQQNAGIFLFQVELTHLVSILVHVLALLHLLNYVADSCLFEQSSNVQVRDGLLEVEVVYPVAHQDAFVKKFGNCGHEPSLSNSLRALNFN